MRAPVETQKRTGTFKSDRVSSKLYLSIAIDRRTRVHILLLCNQQPRSRNALLHVQTIPFVNIHCAPGLWTASYLLLARDATRNSIAFIPIESWVVYGPPAARTLSRRRHDSVKCRAGSCLLPLGLVLWLLSRVCATPSFSRGRLPPTLRGTASGAGPA